MSAPEESLAPRTLAWGSAVLLASALAMLWPMFGPLEQDSFPLSTFPMFARHRGKPKMHQIVGIDADGNQSRLRPEHLGTSEVLQAKVLIDRSARNKQRRQKLCRQVAERVAEDPDFKAVERLELLRVRFDPIRYFTDGPEPLSKKRLHRCNVARDESAEGDGGDAKR